MSRAAAAFLCMLASSLLHRPVLGEPVPSVVGEKSRTVAVEPYVKWEPFGETWSTSKMSGHLEYRHQELDCRIDVLLFEGELEAVEGLGRKVMQVYAMSPGVAVPRMQLRPTGFIMNPSIGTAQSIDHALIILNLASGPAYVNVYGTWPKENRRACGIGYMHLVFSFIEASEL